MIGIIIETLEWERISAIGSVPPPRQGTAMMQLDGKIYLFGGKTSPQDYTNDLFSYDVGTLFLNFQREIFYS